MTRLEILTDLFRWFEATNNPVRVSFIDGTCYDLRILSTVHAEEGGDIVADVMNCVDSPRPEFWRKAAMNFHVKDVVRVDREGECLFTT